MSIQVHMLALGALQTNCYVVADTDTREAVIIDPSDEPHAILTLVQSKGYTVREILATHTHFDHVLAAQPLKDNLGAPFRIHAEGVQQLARSQQIALMYGLSAPEPAEADSFITEGEIIDYGTIRLETVYTPGHSVGHISFVLRSEKVVFSGDCLFQGSIGRTDLPGGDYNTLIASIYQKLIVLGDDYIVYSGHGPQTTIGYERLHNPFLLG